MPAESPLREFAVPPVTEIPDSANLTDHLVTGVREDPDLVQFRRRVDGVWQDVTRRTFVEEVTAVAKGFMAAGVAPGDRVAVMSRTRYEWTVVDFAILFSGAVTVPIYETSSADQVRWILTDSEAVAIVVEDPDLQDLVENLGRDLSHLRHVWQIEAGGLDALARDGQGISDEALEQVRTSPRKTSLATLVYTSGTTGNPKGCMLTHGNVIAAVSSALAGALGQDFTAGTSTLLFLPLAHVFGRDVQFGCTMQGVTMGHTNDLPNLVADLAVFQPNFLLSVPRVFEKVYNLATAKAAAEGRGRIFNAAAATAIAYDAAQAGGGASVLLRLRHAIFDRLVYTKLRARLGGEVTWALSAGAPLGTRLGHFFGGSGITIFEGYGMTENGGPATLNHSSRIQVGSVGQPIPGCTIRIAEDGEVLMRGEHVFAGYWKNPDATAATIDEAGWLHTGDIGELDSQGYLRITGRKKDLIVTAGGKNVAPAVLEDPLRAHPLVSQVVVVGDARPYVAALITLDQEYLPTWLELNDRPTDTPAAKLADDPAILAELQQAVDQANAQVSTAESIRRFRVLPEDLTIDGGQLTPSLKVKRSVVLAQREADVDLLYAER